MATRKNLLVFLLILSWSTGLYGQDVYLRDKVKQNYTAQIGIREKSGRNDGTMVETYLRYCGLPKGQPWCASFVCWSFGQAGIKNPRSGYCPDLFTAKYLIYTRGKVSKHGQPQTGDIFGLYFPEKKRIAHTGFIETWGDTFVITVEGNTNEAGSREGDGVYRKRRPRRSIYAAADFITPK